MQKMESDDLVSAFVTESLEHLSGIETDLLAIEEQGANINDDIINRVFRAAHSIKGGSGFLGLTKIQELAHKTETVLSQIRSKDIVPNPEIINIMLLAFDKLRDLVSNYSTSNDADITENVTALVELTTTFLPKEIKKEASSKITITFGGGKINYEISSVDYHLSINKGQHLFLLRFDLINDIERAGKNPLTVINEIMSIGTIIDANINFTAVGDLTSEPVKTLPFDIIISTLLDETMIDTLSDSAAIEKEMIFLLDKKSEMKPQQEAKPADKGLTQENLQAALQQITEPSKVSAEPALSSVSAPDPQPASEKTEHDSSKQTATGEQKAAGAGGGNIENTLRVNVDLLETLINLAGELVLSRNQLREALSKNDKRLIDISSQRINHVTSELQEALMQTRMQPVGNLFNKFVRLSRDLSRNLKKEIRLDIEGREVELDKTLIEGLSDPLTHMVRNAIDHGIEQPSDRTQKGKNATGVVTLKAYHEAGQVVIEIGDDGKGIDPVKISEAAVRKGLISPEKLKGMTDKDKVALIFLPGLSTAEKVSDVSGRGVGMDVVKTNLDKLGGKVEIESAVSKGSLFRIKMPLTLAIIPSLIVTAEEERFAIPQVNVVELIRIPSDQIKKRIEVIGDAEVLVLRGNLIPIVRLSDILGVVKTYTDPKTGRKEVDRRSKVADRRSPRRGFDDAYTDERGSKENTSNENRKESDRRFRAVSDLNLVVLTTGTMNYGLVVDTMDNTEEIVVKPLGRHLKRLNEYAGATIMGDGKVALILDISGLAVKAQLTSVSGTSRAMQLAEQESTDQKHKQSLLLFHNASDEDCAVPLDLVLRIERIASTQIEKIGGKRTMQYRNSSLPIIALSDCTNVKQIEDTQPLAVLVFNALGREIGLLGSMPIDVIETTSEVDQITLRQTGIAGSLIINNKTVLLVDLHELVDKAFPEWVKEKQENAPKVISQEKCILLAEDSDFFRSQIKKFLVDSGYKVFDAPDGEAAWELLLQNASKISLLVTDIEMPRLTGVELAKRIRADQRFGKLPIIGVTSLAGDDDIKIGMSAGITDYQVKLDRDKLIESIHNFLGL